MEVQKPSKKTDEQAGRELLQAEAIGLAALLTALKAKNLTPDGVARTVAGLGRYIKQRAFTVGRNALQRELDELVPRAGVGLLLPELGLPQLSAKDLDIAAGRAAEKFAAKVDITSDIKRIVATENSLGFNAGKQVVRPKIAKKPSQAALEKAAAGELDGPTLKQIASAADAPFFVSMWNARFDNTCPVCAAMHGRTTDRNGNFPGGLEPGLVHPNCRCYTTSILVKP